MESVVLTPRASFAPIRSARRTRNRASNRDIDGGGVGIAGAAGAARGAGLGHRSALVTCVASLDDVAWPGVALVVECVPENLGQKQALFAQLVQHADPATVLASNSSSFPISVRQNQLLYAGATSRV